MTREEKLKECRRIREEVREKQREMDDLIAKGKDLLQDEDVSFCFI